MKSHRSQNETIRELVNLISSKGINLPSELSKKIENPELFSLKLEKAKAGKSEEELKKNKVRISDLEFERRKIEEDFAQYKLIARQEKDR
jgi:S-adenosylmethionine synthetase